MRAVIQRVSRAQVSVDGTVLGKIDRGFLILLGVSGEDSREIAERMADKICRLRIFEDADGKTNCSLADVGGALLVISQWRRCITRASPMSCSRCCCSSGLGR